MASDCVMLEGCRVDAVEEGGNGNGNEIELSLELSIGGSYAKSKNLMASGVRIDADFEETGRSLGGSGEFGVLFDPQAKREIQALRRQEARKKREEKLKKAIRKGTNGYGSGSGSGDGGSGGVHCVADDSRVRARDREGEVRENGDGTMEPARKREKNGDGIDGENKGSIPVVPVQFTSGFVNFHGGMTCWGAIGVNEVKSEKCVFQPTGCRSFRPYQGNRNSEQNGGKEGTPANASVSPGRSSSVFSDYQSSTLLGGNTSDNGSNSSYCQAKVQRQVSGSAPSDPPEQSEHSGSCKHMESNQAADSSADSLANVAPSCIPQPSAVKQSEEPKSEPQPNLVDNHNPTCNTNHDPLKETNAVTSKSPRPQTENPETTLRPQMPCVSTTGNGPNGKTVMGFLYRYTKTEVSIVCVCHGSSFSPAEFVEHAGGINIAHPLRHITVIPSAFGR